MELILVRHAEPFVGEAESAASFDPPLSPAGRAQAERVAAWLDHASLDRVVSSPARRARETAEVTAHRAGVDVVVDDRLRDAEEAGARYVPIEVDRATDPAAYRARVDGYRDSPRLASIADRVHEALDEWVARTSGGRVAVFCHGSVVNVYAARVLGLPAAAFLEAAYASGHRFLVSSSGIRSVQSLNETAYLIG